MTVEFFKNSSKIPPPSTFLINFLTYIEGEVFLATTIVGFCAVGIEVDGEGLAGQGLEVQVLSHQTSLDKIGQV